MSSHYKGVKNDKVVIYNPVKGTLTLKPKALDITWGNDARYWKLPSLEEGPVELLQVSWLEVNGKAPMSSFERKGDYAVKFKVELKADNFGWAGQPVYLMVGIDKQRSWRKADLSTKTMGTIFDIPIDTPLTFKATEDTKEKMVEFGMFEIWKRRWKGGLTIHEVVIEPVESPL